MNTIKDAVRAVGVGPLALAAVGLFYKRFRWPALAASAVWGLGTILLAKRDLDVHATVTAEEPTISYKSTATAGSGVKSESPVVDVAPGTDDYAMP